MLRSFAILTLSLLFSCSSKVNRREDNVNIKEVTEVQQSLETRHLFRKEYETNKNSKERQNSILSQAQKYLLAISEVVDTKIMSIIYSCLSGLSSFHVFISDRFLVYFTFKTIILM